MWSDIREQLTRILSTEAFLNLRHDPEYLRLFEDAGLPGIIPRELTVLRPEMRNRVESSARTQAQLITLRMGDLGTSRIRNASVMLLKPGTSLYRIWSPKDPVQRGSWWFSQHLLESALTSAAGRHKSALLWLRHQLGLETKSAGFDRLQKLALPDGETIPAVALEGLPARKPTSESIPFRHEHTQYFLPFLPVQHVVTHW